jgi:hypothetical protein
VTPGTPPGDRPSGAAARCGDGQDMGALCLCRAGPAPPGTVAAQLITTIIGNKARVVIPNQE